MELAVVEIMMIESKNDILSEKHMHICFVLSSSVNHVLFESFMTENTDITVTRQL